MDALTLEYIKIIIGIIGFASAVIGPSLFPFCIHPHNNTYHYPFMFTPPKVCKALNPLGIFLTALGLIILPFTGWLYFLIAFGLGILNAFIVWSCTC